MKKTLCLIASCMALLMPACAQTLFRTAELERLAEAMALNVELLPEGYSHPVVGGHALTVHISDHTVNHIGMFLFNDAMRSVNPSPVFNFLERYFLQLKYPQQMKTNADMIRDDQFVFTEGLLADIDKILPTDDFTYIRDNHCYLATWSRNGLTILSVKFPVVYELMSGENKIEAEKNLQADIQNTRVNNYFVQGNSTNVATYISNAFSNRLYETDGKLIASEKHPIETAANMMLSLQVASEEKLVITQLSYGFQQTVFTVPLRQWITFCRNQGCELYFGVENVSDQGDVYATVIAVNEAENYNHVMTVCIPAKCIAGR
mgnify:CR=1 FL=1